jgi:hypothetical protein
MNLLEAIKTGLPHKRKNDDYVYFVPHVGGIGYSQQDVLAEDWEIAGQRKIELDLTNVVPLKKRGRPKKEKK